MTASTTHAPVASQRFGFSAMPRAALLIGACFGISLTGCQVDYGGQTLPSAYYLQDDIQYFPAGPEFKLSKEAAAQKAYKKEILESETIPGPGPYGP